MDGIIVAAFDKYEGSGQFFDFDSTFVSFRGKSLFGSAALTVDLANNPALQKADSQEVALRVRQIAHLNALVGTVMRYSNLTRSQTSIFTTMLMRVKR